MIIHDDEQLRRDFKVSDPPVTIVNGRTFLTTDYKVTTGLSVTDDVSVFVSGVTVSVDVGLISDNGRVQHTRSLTLSVDCRSGCAWLNIHVDAAAYGLIHEEQLLPFINYGHRLLVSVVGL